VNTLSRFEVAEQQAKNLWMRERWNKLASYIVDEPAIRKGVDQAVDSSGGMAEDLEAQVHEFREALLGNITRVLAKKESKIVNTYSVIHDDVVAREVAEMIDERRMNKTRKFSLNKTRK
jgi:hypothetical protein